MRDQSHFRRTATDAEMHYTIKRHSREMYDDAMLKY